MAIQATKASISLRVVHPSWLGRPVFGTIADVPNAFHVDVSTTGYGVLRMAQASLVWQHDYKPAR